MAASRASVWLRLSGWLVTAVLCAWVAFHVDGDALSAALGKAELWLVILAAAIQLGPVTAARVMRWRALLEPLPSRGKAPGFGRLAPMLLTCTALNNLLPARAGELARVLPLQRDPGYELASLLASQGLEKLVEVLGMVLLAAASVALSRPPGVFVVAFGALVGIAVGATVLVLALGWLGRRHGDGGANGRAKPTGLRARVLRFAASIAGSMCALNHGRVWLVALAWSTAADLLDLLTVGLCLVAVGVELPPESWCWVFIAINLAIAIPAAPGHAGTLEGAAVVALGAMGVGASDALAFALLYHVAQLVPMTLAGLACQRAARRVPA